MFCPNCGTSNDDDALFCGNCGTDLRNIVSESGAKEINNGYVQEISVNETNNGYGQEISGYVQSGGYTANSENAQGSDYGYGKGNASSGGQPQITAKKTLSKWSFVIVAEAALMILGIYVLARIIGDINSPERVAENYFVHVANGEWEAAYGDLDIEEIEAADSSFINKKMYEKCQAQTSLGIISNYQVSMESDRLNDLGNLWDGLDADSGSLEKSVRIDYRVKNNMENSIYTVYLNNPVKNQWKVSASNLLCRDYDISIPRGAGVNVDGIDLGIEYLTKTDDYTDVYTIPFIFYGIHEIKVTMEDMEDVNQIVEIDYGSAYYCDTMYMKQEVLDTLIQKAGENMQQIYNAAIAGKSLKMIGDLFTTDAECLESINERYGYLLSDLNEGSFQVQKISFSNIKAEAYPYEPVVNISFDYTIEYTYEDWWSGDIEKDTYDDSSSSEVKFVKENGNWVQTNLGCDTLYY